MQMNDDDWFELGQYLIDELSLGDKFCLKELYGENWESMTGNKGFGSRLRKAVKSGDLKNIKYVKIRTSGRCNEYERI